LRRGIDVNLESADFVEDKVVDEVVVHVALDTRQETNVPPWIGDQQRVVVALISVVGVVQHLKHTKFKKYSCSGFWPYEIISAITNCACPLGSKNTHAQSPLFSNAQAQFLCFSTTLDQNYLNAQLTIQTRH